MTSTKTQLPYDYYDVGVHCKPSNGTKYKSENLGIDKNWNFPMKKKETIEIDFSRRNSSRWSNCEYKFSSN